MLKARAGVLKMKEYHPPLGGRVGMRLDFNENTGGCSPRVLEKLRSLDYETLNRYPERDSVEAVVAQHMGLDAADILLTNGVDEGIHLLCEAYIEPGDQAIIPVPTFSMYEIYAMAAEARVVTVQAGKDFEFPTEELIAKIEPRTRLIAIATPNNPTGGVVDEATLLRIAAAAPQAAVLVDEAYFDFYGKTLMPRVREVPNLFVARTFSKAHGLAGLRCGILAGNREQMRMVRRVGSPYNVNAIALEALPEALADREYIANYVKQVRRGRARVEAELSELGIEFWPSLANFVLMRLGDKRQAFVAAMKARDILVRDRNSDPGCAGCVRITVGTDEQTETLITSMRAVLQEIGWLSTPTMKRSSNAPGAGAAR